MEYGGYFDLELRGDYTPPGAIRFATARGCLNASLIDLCSSNSGRNVLHLPEFLCPSVKCVVVNAHPNIEIRPYSIGESFEPLDVEIQSNDEIFYSYDTFGLSSHKTRLAISVVADNVHALFKPRRSADYTFTSLRKYLGVADGGLLYCPTNIVEPATSLDPDHVRHLLVRQHASARSGYTAFQDSEDWLAGALSQAMSRFSRSIMAQIDLAEIKRRRAANFCALHERFARDNALRDIIDRALSAGEIGLFSYPFLRPGRGEVRSKLHAKNIFAPLLWQFAEEDSNLSEFERTLAEDTLHLPIDQRYGPDDIARMADIVIDVLRL